MILEPKKIPVSVSILLMKKLRHRAIIEVVRGGPSIKHAACKGQTFLVEIVCRTKICVCSVAPSCPILCDPVDCDPPSLSVHGIFPARILEQVVISFSRGLSDPGIEPASPLSLALHVNS